MQKAAAFILIVLSAALLWACSDDSSADVDPALARILNAGESVCPWSATPAPAPDGGCKRLRSRNLGAPLGRVFNDVNAVHLAHAHEAGMKVPHTVEELWTNSRGLVRVRSCKLYYIDSLSHSFPYLTPGAAELLDDIGRRFQDSLAVRGGGAYRPKVTSLLRTATSVSKLRRVNRNATSESAHRYATTFDISYSKFICDDASDTRRTFEDLKNLLAEVVSDLRDEGRCVVKHERRQACFHITVTDSPSTRLNTEIYDDYQFEH